MRRMRGRHSENRAVEGQHRAGGARRARSGPNAGNPSGPAGQSANEFFLDSMKSLSRYVLSRYLTRHLIFESLPDTAGPHYAPPKSKSACEDPRARDSDV